MSKLQRRAASPAERASNTTQRAKEVWRFEPQNSPDDRFLQVLVSKFGCSDTRLRFLTFSSQKATKKTKQKRLNLVIRSGPNGVFHRGPILARIVRQKAGRTEARPARELEVRTYFNMMRPKSAASLGLRL
jgi:hypothetical protein